MIGNIFWVLVYISILIAIVFGWDVMKLMWVDIFDWVGELGEIILERLNSE